MLGVFSDLADWLTFGVLHLNPDSKFADATHFFIEDVSKIFVLLVVMIYSIALLRASLKVEKVRDYLAGKHRGLGYFLGSGFGAITPFCSCSSIPVFLGFTSAGIPVGITMAFLLTSPLINEVAVLLLMSLLGWKFTFFYIVVGMAVGILGGLFLDAIRAGSGCTKCVNTAELIEKIATEQHCDVSVTKETNPEVIMGYGVMSTPAVVIDETVVHSGSMPTQAQISSWLQK